MACGGDEGPSTPDPVTTEQTQVFAGLFPGSCYDYEFTIPGSMRQSVSRVDVVETEPFRYPGRVTVRWDQALTGGDSTVRIFEFRGPVMVLLESIRGSMPEFQRFYEVEGQEVDMRFPEPVWLELLPPQGSEDFPRLDLGPDDGFITQTTPELQREAGMQVDDPPEEIHTWRVVSNSAQVDRGDLGTFEAIELRYEIARGADRETSTWFLAPGVGFVRFTDFSGTQFRLIDYRVTRPDGTSEGAIDCSG
jgi:hypothetical protein